MKECAYCNSDGLCTKFDLKEVYGQKCIELDNIWNNEVTRCRHHFEIKTDNVNHPNHYTRGGIECIKAIEASMTPEGFQDYCKGNVEKYIWRWREKNGLEDLKKAQVYLSWMIESVEKQEGTTVK